MKIRKTVAAITASRDVASATMLAGAASSRDANVAGEAVELDNHGFGVGRRPLAAAAVAITLGFGALGLAQAPHAAAAPAFPTICADLDREGDPTATFDRAMGYAGNQGWTRIRLRNEVTSQLWTGCPNRVGDWLGWWTSNFSF